MMEDLPWRPVKHDPPDVGDQVMLRFRDPVGTYEGVKPCFLHDDGCFYVIDPPTRVAIWPTHWRPVTR